MLIEVFYFDDIKYISYDEDKSNKISIFDSSIGQFYSPRIIHAEKYELFYTRHHDKANYIDIGNSYLYQCPWSGNYYDYYSLKYAEFFVRNYIANKYPYFKHKPRTELVDMVDIIINRNEKLKQLDI